jgi:2-hydroxy-6-oxonona-2,4-dienedioate hydrolase
MLAMAPERFIDVGGVRTRYFEQGAGPVIVLFHGGEIGSATDACSALDWEPIFGAISQSFCVVAVDRLGHGHTDNPRSDADYTMAASIEHAAQFLRALGKEPYHVVGHSSGGFLVARLGLIHPELLKTCVIVNGVSLVPGIGREHIVRNNPPNPFHSHSSIRWICERQCYSRDAVTDDWVDQIFNIAQSERNRLAVRKMNDERLRETVYLPGFAKQLGPTHRLLLERGMPCSTLLAWFLQDPVGDVSNGRLLVEMFQEKQPKTEARYFNRAGHYVFREQPKAFAMMLKHYVMAFN